MPTSFPRPDRPAEAWAEVHARNRVIRYRRSGAGHTVIVVGPSPVTPPLWNDLHRTLARDFRLIVPEAPAVDVDPTCWLSDFLDGLGLVGASIVAADRFCVPALEIAVADPHLLARLVLLPDGDGGMASAAPLHSTDEERWRLPLLVVRSGIPAGEAVSLIAGFLAGAGHGAPS